MGLMQKALETYDAMSSWAGVERENAEPLAPVGHRSAKAKIEITIDQEGRFIQAQRVDRYIIFPVTEDSAGRTSGAVAHALCDQVGYLLPGTKKNALYLEQLRSWEKSPYTNPKLTAILKYVEAGTILDDLIRADLINYDEKQEIKNDHDLICWIVNGLGEKSGPVWKDQDLIRLYQNYYLSLNVTNHSAICMLTGNVTRPTQKHMKGIVSLHGSAKIISSKDEGKFTYLGRFLNNDEALSVGYEASQKAHNALKWFVSNQGVVRGGRAFLCWNPHGVQIAHPLGRLFRKREEDKPPTPSEYRDQLRRIIDGYKASLPQGEEVIIASFDAATTGRLAVTYYAELQGSDFIDRLAFWDQTCCWNHYLFGVSAPSLFQIVTCAFGTQRGSDEQARMEVDDQLLAGQLDRLLYTKLNKSPFPLDLVKAIVAKAENLQVFNSNNRNNLLFVACAVIRKTHLDHYKEEIAMALEPNRHDRSYQFGRLLAVMEKIERDTYDREEDREPNAIRMQPVFVRRPGYAAKIVIDQLKGAYYPRLKPGARVYYDRLIGEIMEVIDSFGPEQYNRPLSETYLPGYYLQKNALFAKKDQSAEGQPVSENTDVVSDNHE